MTVRHSKVSAKDDPSDSGLVGKTDWNADHQVSSFAFDSGVITPSSLAAQADDWSPTGWNDTEPSKATVIRAAGTAARTITGLAGGAQGRLAIIINAGSYPLTLADESASSTAANRFTLCTSSKEIIFPEQAMLFVYNTTTSRWEEIATNRLDDIIIPLAGDISNNATATISDITGWSFTAAANATYELEIIGFFTSAATTTGIWLGFNTPASPTAIMFLTLNGGSTAGNATVGDQVADDTVGTPSTSARITGSQPVWGKGILINGANAGTVQARIRTEVNASAVTLKAGSILRAKRVA